MTTVLIMLGYAAGVGVGSRLALGMLMNRAVCSKGSVFLDICRQYHGHKCARPLGELRTRSLGDAAKALGLGLVWPVVIVLHLILNTTPPTAGEAQRLLAEQAARIETQRREIERLTRTIS